MFPESGWRRRCSRSPAGGGNVPGGRRRCSRSPAGGGNVPGVRREAAMFPESGLGQGKAGGSERAAPSPRMGGSQSSGTEGYHVYGIQDNSPAQIAGLEPFFDFILAIGNTRLNKDNDTFKDLLVVNVEKPVKLEVYNMKAARIREVEVIPNNMWGGQGLLGASVRFCSFEGAHEHIWRVLDVEPNSPAAMAGLKPQTDYIIGADQVLQETEDFFNLIEAYEGKPLKLMVYSSETDAIREVVVTPNGAWGGEGSLGCGIGYGYLHRIPSRPIVPKKKVEMPAPPPAVASTPPQNLEKGYTEAPLIAPSSPKDGTNGSPDLEQSLTNLTMESSLLPPPIQRVMDPGFPPGSTDIPEAHDLSDILKMAVTSSSSPIFNTITERKTGTNGVLVSEELDLPSDHTTGAVPEVLNSVSAELCAAASMEDGLDQESCSISDLTVPSLPTSTETPPEAHMDDNCTESVPEELVECPPQCQNNICDSSVMEEEAKG
ncbi:Golgi reassembly-stacking protein 1-like [Stegostoma tigrinum]|uniref:Golgi reassembly-stacking protein 1-like n=1 Tax=Stegostoma tigrinum TaxID=3053191 RepID=UPI00286FB697|nr:Golgi reassembly-stacking protein 1-like [Stegostoma tigrinum]